MRVFAHSLDVAACQKVFFCCAISVSPEMAVIRLLKRKRELSPCMFLLYKAERHTSGCCDTLISTHVPEDVNLEGFGQG